MRGSTGDCLALPVALPAADIHRLARSFLLLSARRGSVQALLDLGRMHHSGQGVQINRPRALGYYRQAARTGNAEGYYRMGRLLSEHSPSEGIEEDFLGAWSAYLQGARLHHAPSVQALQAMTNRLPSTRHAVSPDSAILSSR